MRSQRKYLEGLIDDIDDADDEYWLIRDAADAVDVYIDCMQSSTLQSVQSLVSISHANSDSAMTGFTPARVHDISARTIVGNSKVSNLAGLIK